MPAADSTQLTPLNAPPCWEEVPFEVRCPACGVDLRGQTEAQCAACGLEIDWAQEVPLDKLTCGQCGYHLRGLPENRCPECGTEFTWEDALLDYRGRKTRVFEYCWRSQPVKSLLRSFGLATRPSRLWSTLNVYDPPRVMPLLGMVLLALLALLVLNVIQFGLSDWIIRKQWLEAPRVRLADIPVSIGRAFLNPWAYRNLLPFSSWLLLTLAALLLFPQSLSRRRIRIVHAFRIWAYTAPMILAVMVIAVILVIGSGFVVPEVWYLRLDYYAMTVGLGAVTWSLARAWSRYLQLPHGLAVAISTQLIALLGASCLGQFLIGDGSLAGFLLWLIEGGWVM